MKSNLNDKTFFMGRVTASVSHDLQNVLAIIRETAGLMQDFLMKGNNCHDLDEKLEKSLSSIKNQVNRGVALTSGLNRFAHTADHRLCPIDIRDTLERLILLTERMAKNKGFTVILAPGAFPLLNHDPIAFQTLCFLCLEALENTLPTGNTLVISAKNHNTGPTLLFTCPDLSVDTTPSPTSWVHWTSIEDACRLSQVTLSLTDSHPGICLRFS